jgi:hypothetical protein
MRGSLVLFLLIGCSRFETIDGSSVPKIGADGAPPTCEQACARLAALCGYAPNECTNADAAGYCEANFDGDHLACVGSAASCAEASSCANAPPPDARDAGSADDAADAESVDGAADAAAGPDANARDAR